MRILVRGAVRFGHEKETIAVGDGERRNMKVGQVTDKMRKTTHGFSWWCPGCDEMHPLPFERGWTFDGNLAAPTFTPSFKHDWNNGNV